MYSKTHRLIWKSRKQAYYMAFWRIDA